MQFFGLKYSCVFRYTYTFLIPGNPNGNRYISILGTSTYGNNIYIDEVAIENIPSCLEPTSLIKSGITTTMATISWTAPSPAPANGYDYYLTTNNSTPTPSTIPTGNVAAGIITKSLFG